jgi:precorrin-6B methylase 1
MWESKHDLDINIIPNISSLIIKSPKVLVDLNQTCTMSLLPKDQTNIHHVHILSYYVNFETATLNNPIFEVDR